MKRSILLHSAAAVLAIGAATLTQTTSAQNAATWPTKPVTFIIPSTAGGPSEIEGRLYTQKLSENLGQPFVFDFKPGAEGIVAAQALIRAGAAGNALLFSTSSYTVSAAFSTKLPFDPMKDIVPVIQMTSRASVLAVTKALPVNNVAEYIAWARANPGKLNFGTAVSGGTQHVAGALLAIMTNTDITFIHYKGSAAKNIDMMAGRLHASTSSFATSMPLHKSGKLHVIATTGSQRSPLYPDLPTIGETVPGYEHASWTGIFGAGSLSRDLLARINAEMVKVGKVPEIAKKLNDDNAVMVLGPPEQFRQMIARDMTNFRRLSTEYGIKLGDD